MREIGFPVMRLGTNAEIRMCFKSDIHDVNEPRSVACIFCSRSKCHDVIFEFRVLQH